jgi:hypothetical protein
MTALRRPVSGSRQEQAQLPPLSPCQQAHKQQEEGRLTRQAGRQSHGTCIIASVGSFASRALHLSGHRNLFLVTVPSHINLLRITPPAQRSLRSGFRFAVVKLRQVVKRGVICGDIVYSLDPYRAASTGSANR